MGFMYNWNTKIICQFYCSLYYSASDATFHWTNEGVHYCVDYMTFSCILGLGFEHEKYDPIHVERRIKSHDATFMFFNPILAREGKSTYLQSYYNYANFMMRWRIDPKKGDYIALNFYAVNLLNRMALDGRPFNAFDFIWNELRRVMDDSRKHLPYAPYMMYMIERVTKITFPKDVKHEPLHLRPRSEMPAHSSKHHGSSSSAPLVDDPPLCAPSYTPISSRRRGNGSMVKRVLRSIFCMCKTMVREVNANHRDIIEMKSEMGLPCDLHHELPEFDDPFAEWDAQYAKATREEEEPTPAPPTQPTRIAPRQTQRARDEEEDTDEDVPQQYFEHDNDDDDEEEDDDE
jgi:hypothetical protein